MNYDFRLAEKALEKEFERVNDIRDFNQRKVLKAFFDNKVAPEHFYTVSGCQIMHRLKYGYQMQNVYVPALFLHKKPVQTLYQAPAFKWSDRKGNPRNRRSE